MRGRMTGKGLGEGKGSETYDWRLWTPPADDSSAIFLREEVKVL